MNEKFGLSGKLKLENPRTGEVREIPNTIMNVGKSVVSSMIGSDIANGIAFDWMALGTSGLAAAATQIQLGSEQVRVLTASAQATTTTTNDTARFIGSFGISGTQSIQEAGLFNGTVTADTGSMLARTTFAALSVISGDSINATWDAIVA